MGGNALKKVKTVRLPKSTYSLVEEHVVKVISDYCLNIFVPRYSDQKTCFGDLDIIIVPKDPSKFRSTLESLFNPREIVKSGDVLSIDYNLTVWPYKIVDQHGEGSDIGDSFQVDFIHVSPDNFHISCFYFSFNDFGAILGTIFKNWQLSFGSYGLFHDVCYNDDKTIQLKKILITTNPTEICQIAGLHSEFLKNFFDNQYGGASPITWNQIFEWLTTSPLFKSDYWHSKSIYWNHSERKRIELRPMYREFLFKYIPERYSFHPEINFKPEETKVHIIAKEERQLFIRNLLTKYGLWSSREDILKKHEIQLTAKKKFSGELVKSLSNLEDKALGNFIVHLKTKHSQTLGNKYWLANPETSQSEIEKIIQEEHSKYY